MDHANPPGIDLEEEQSRRDFLDFRPENDKQYINFMRAGLTTASNIKYLELSNIKFKKSRMSRLLVFFSAMTGIVSFALMTSIVADWISDFNYQIVALASIVLGSTLAFIQLIFYNDECKTLLQRSASDFLKVRTILQGTNLNNRRMDDDEMLIITRNALEKYSKASQDSLDFLGNRLSDIDQKLRETTLPNQQAYAGLSDPPRSYDHSN